MNTSTSSLLHLSSLLSPNTSISESVEIDPEGSLFAFRMSYLKVHGYLSISVCIFGIVANIANIIVLTKKEMISATNSILTGLAVSDMMVMLDYIPFSIHSYIRTDLADEDKYSYNWAVFALFHAHFSVVCHSISTWLTVLLAVWRYISVRHPVRARAWCSQQKAYRLILATYVAVIVCCIPVYICFTIRQSEQGVRTYYVGWSSIARESNELLMKINFWVFSVGLKLGPCILLTYLSLTLIQALVEADERKARLQNRSLSLDESSSSNMKNASQDQRSRLATINDQNPLMVKRCSLARPYSDRTNQMLLAVLLLFLITEFPQGILVLLSGILGDTFFSEVYRPLGEVLDILALVNSSINFILYCTTSSIFRQTFCSLFCRCSTVIPSDPLTMNTLTTTTTTTTTNERRTTITHLKSQDFLDTPL